MASAAELARSRYQVVTRTQRALVAAIQAIWRRMSAATVADDLEGELGARILAAVVAGQLTVAQGAQAFVAAAMRAQGGNGVPEALLVAEAFGGIAPDGGPLDTLLYLPAIGVRRRLAAGMTGEEAMVGGLADMAMYAATAVSDTARASVQVAMAADRQTVMYTRVVTLPACARCIILAGQTYSYSTGFLRHPNCDCQVVPLSEAQGADVQSPEALYRRMSAAERRRVFTVDGAKALEAGADLGQVVNARRGMDLAGVHGRSRRRTTSEGVTRRGVYGRSVRRAGGEFARTPGQRYARAGAERLTPQEIFVREPDSRERQQELLRRYGYLV